MDDEKQATPTIRSKLVFIDFTGFTASSEYICQLMSESFAPLVWLQISSCKRLKKYIEAYLFF